MTRNRKTIEGLIRIAKNCEESVFQKNKEYVKLKAEKNISTSEIELMVCELNFDFLEEKIYWNKRALEEKVGDKEQRDIFLSNLVFIYSELKEYELVLEYGKKPMEWLDLIQKYLSEYYKMIVCKNTRLKLDKKLKKCMNHMQQTWRGM